MNDADLQKKLRALHTPAPSEMARERARHRALLAFAQIAALEPKRQRGALGWALAAGAATLAVAVAVAAVFWPSLRSADQSGSGGAVLLAQVEALFPGQLNAVIENKDGEMKVALGAEEQSASDQPLLVEFRRGDSLVRVLSYSGRHVCVNLGGRHACFDALIGDHGKVIVAGEDFVWTRQNRVSADGWQITAAPLGKSS